MQAGAWAVELYEPELLASADARTTIDYNGKPRSVINLCSYNYLGLANHPRLQSVYFYVILICVKMPGLISLFGAS